MTMTVDEPRHQEAALEVDQLPAAPHHPGDLGAAADGHDLVAADRDGFRIRVRRLGGKDLTVEEDALVRGSWSCGALKTGVQQQRNEHGVHIRLLSGAVKPCGTAIICSCVRQTDEGYAGARVPWLSAPLPRTRRTEHTMGM